MCHASWLTFNNNLTSRAFVFAFILVRWLLSTCGVCVGPCALTAVYIWSMCWTLCADCCLHVVCVLDLILHWLLLAGGVCVCLCTVHNCVFQGMFCTDSAVRQLKPELILQHVLEAEERQWSTVHLGLDSDDCESTATSSSVNTPTTSDCHNPGLVLLRYVTGSVFLSWSLCCSCSCLYCSCLWLVSGTIWSITCGHKAKDIPPPITWRTGMLLLI